MGGLTDLALDLMPMLVFTACAFSMIKCYIVSRCRRHVFPETIQITNRIREMDSIGSMEHGSADIVRDGSDRMIPLPRAEFIHWLPLVTYTKNGALLTSMHLETKLQMSECPVCLNEYNEAESILLLPNCKHVFHPICISTWLQSHTTCPLCRINVEVSKHTKNQSSLKRVLSGITRSEGSHIVDLSAHHRDSDPQDVIVDLTSPQHQYSSNVNTNGLLPIAHPRTCQPECRDFQEERASEAPDPCTSSSTLEVGTIFSSVYETYVDDIHKAGPSSSSSVLTQVPVTTTDSEKACCSASTNFVTVSLDTDQPDQ